MQLGALIRRFEPAEGEVAAYKVACVGPDLLFRGITRGFYRADDSAICEIRTGAHAAPDAACHCGFHALKDRSEALALQRVRGRSALLEVHLFGRCLEFDAGYRAERQKVVAVTLPRALLYGRPPADVADAWGIGIDRLVVDGHDRAEVDEVARRMLGTRIPPDADDPGVLARPLPRGPQPDLGAAAVELLRAARRNPTRRRPAERLLPAVTADEPLVTAGAV